MRPGSEAWWPRQRRATGPQAARPWRGSGPPRGAPSRGWPSPSSPWLGPPRQQQRGFAARHEPAAELVAHAGAVPDRVPGAAVVRRRRSLSRRAGLQEDAGRLRIAPRYVPHTGTGRSALRRGASRPPPGLEAGPPLPPLDVLDDDAAADQLCITPRYRKSPAHHQRPALPSPRRSRTPQTPARRLGLRCQRGHHASPVTTGACRP